MIAIAQALTGDRRESAREDLRRRACERLLEGFSEPVVLLERDGRILIANRALASAHGRTPDELRGRHVGEFLRPVSVRAIISTVAAVIEDGRVRATVNMTRGYWWRRRYWRVGRDDGLTAVCAVRCDPWRAPIMGGASEHDPMPVVIPDHDLADLAALSEREGEVLWMIGQGKSHPAIAREMTRSPKTIETHVRSISAKLGVSGRVALARLALERGLVMMTHEQVLGAFARAARADPGMEGYADDRERSGGEFRGAGLHALVPRLERSEA